MICEHFGSLGTPPGGLGHLFGPRLQFWWFLETFLVLFLILFGYNFYCILWYPSGRHFLQNMVPEASKMGGIWRSFWWHFGGPAISWFLIPLLHETLCFEVGRVPKLNDVWWLFGAKWSPPGISKSLKIVKNRVPEASLRAPFQKSPKMMQFGYPPDLKI